MADGRTPIVAGNWKMNTTLQRAVELASGVAAAAGKTPGVDAVVVPPACFIGAVVDAVGDAPVGVGGQNCHPEPGGAFTGELSVAMLASVGARYVICGHSERRHLFGETPRWIGDKVRAVQAGGLIPILCVGETLEEREADATRTVVAEQLDAGLAHLDAGAVAEIIIAYEPVWAIGTGRVASPEQAQDVHAFIRARLAERCGADIARRVRLQYGGSVKPANAAGLLSQPDIDGALVGGASLDAQAFAAILAAGAATA